jgi:two-component system, OmpR family, phosphate regulon sensor histidine kinase PhoR
MHRLSAKIALLTTAASMVVGAIPVFLIGLPVAASLLPGGVVVFFVCYFASRYFLHRRLLLALETLNQIRKHQFESLEEARLPKGDELSDLTWQVYRTGRVLEREIEELKKVENYRRVFIGNVSHELKTPIFSILGFAETLLSGAIDDETVNRSFIRKIERNAGRLRNLTRDLTEISKLETGELEMQFLPFDIRELVLDIVDSLEDVASTQQVQLTSRLADELPPAVGDVRHIRQVLENLVANALKYTNPGGHVEVIVRESHLNNLKISVADDGIGISDEHLDRVTERFFRVDTSRSRSAGSTGLGLAIAKHILAAHDESLQIQSIPGKGSTFGFSLPVTGPDPDANTLSDSSQKQTSGSQS